MTALDLIAELRAALERSHRVLDEAAIAIKRTQADIEMYREMAAQAMAERDELRMALAMRGGRAVA